MTEVALSLRAVVSVEEAIRTILITYDDDPERPDLCETPRRVAEMYRELLTPEPFTFTTFEIKGVDQMVVEAGIPFFSLCEHHLLPFIGHATIGYLPGARVPGLSKVARSVEYFARRLQTQERMTRDIADYLMEQLEPLGVGVVLRAEHLCMALRGVRKDGIVTATSALRAAFRDNAETRAEFFAHVHQGGAR